jgi:hypothetical protein
LESAAQLSKLQNLDTAVAPEGEIQRIAATRSHPHLR